MGLGFGWLFRVGIGLGTRWVFVLLSFGLNIFVAAYESTFDH